jgi:transglutaminase-like putative cysteine protease
MIRANSGGLILRFSVFLPFVTVLVISPALAQGEKVLRGPVPSWVAPSELLPVPEDASGIVFVRRSDALARLDDNGQAQYVGTRIKLLHPSALEAGNISFDWNPASGATTVHMINVYRDGQTIDVLKNSSFEILRRETQLEAAMLDGTLTAVLRVPDLRVGDELEVAMTTVVKDPTLGKEGAGLLVLAPAPHPGRYRMGLSWNKGKAPRLQMTADMTAAAQESDRGVDFRFDNPPLLAPPKDAPARYQWLRTVQYSSFADWEAVSRHFAPLYKKASLLKANAPIRKEAERIAAAHSDEFARAAAALKLVQQDVRYIYVGLNGGNLTPASATETWERRYGDCKGKTALLLALLSAMGIEAEAVLVSNRGFDDGLDERLPNPGMFDHVLVRAKIGGKSYWLDGTLPPVVPPDVDPTFPYKWTLPLTEKGNSLEPLPWRPAVQPHEIVLFDIDAQGGFDKPAPVTMRRIRRGVEGLQQQVGLSALTAEQLLNGFRQQMIGNSWQSVDEAKWHFDQKAKASVLTVRGTWVLDWEDDGYGGRSMTLPSGGFNPPERRVRPDEQNQELPYYNKPDFDCSATVVRLPKNTAAENWSTNTSFNTQIFGRTYYRAFETREGSIRMVRGLRVNQEEIAAADALKDNSRISSFDNSMARISYHPERKKIWKPGNPEVPALDEIDWTTDSAACLP